MHHLVVGTGPAGVIAAETLRRVDPDAAVTLVGDEPEPPYSRMALPYLMGGNVREQGTYLRQSRDHYEQQGIELRRGKVTGIDAANSKAQLNGESIAYDRLLIATGSRAIRPPIAGMDLPGVENCWTLEDARNIMRHGPGSRVVLIGAGFIGSIILESLALRGDKLTVIEVGDRMVPRMMDEVAGNMLRRWCESKGLRILTSTEVKGIAKAGSNLVVEVAGSEPIPADLVICATGVAPNLELIKGTGIRTEFGILVDHHLQSSVANVYAAGDVCQGRDFSTGEYNVHAIQPTAADHGRIAAMNMAGRDCVHQGSVSMNVLATLGLVSSSFGLWQGNADSEQATLRDDARYRYLSLQFEEDRLIGAQAVGMTEHIGVLRGLIQTSLKLGRWKQRLQENPLHVMEAYLGSTQAIGYNARVFFS